MLRTLDFIFIMEIVTNAKGGQVLLYKGHKYHVNRRNDNTNRIFWRCYDRKCPGRATSKSLDVAPTKDHNHLPNSTMITIEKYKTELKEDCAKSLETIPKLYNDMLARIAEKESDTVAAFMPTYTSIQSSLYRERQKTIPKLPKDKSEIIIENEWTQTVKNQRFLLRIDGDEKEKIIIFATDKMLERLCNTNTLYMDGTFSSCPRLFYQLFTINIYIGDQQFPAIYALLPGKSRNIYNRLFLLIKEELQNKSLTSYPNRVMIDFELALLQSVQLHFPQVDLSGCYFHFHKCLYRWVQEHGYSTEYAKQEDFYNFVRCSAALAFIPVSCVRTAWFGLKSSALDNASYIPFINYFSKTWINGFPIKTWNHYTTTEDRTNNTLEGWHNRLNKLVGRDHPNIYQLIKLMKKEEAVSEVKILQISHGGAPVQKKAKFRVINNRIDRLKEQCLKLPMQDYLNAMKHLTGL